jgi:hypothetical protein
MDICDVSSCVEMCRSMYRFKGYSAYVIIIGKIDPPQLLEVCGIWNIATSQSEAIHVGGH